MFDWNKTKNTYIEKYGKDSLKVSALNGLEMYFKDIFNSDDEKTVDTFVDIIVKSDEKHTVGKHNFFYQALMLKRHLELGGWSIKELVENKDYIVDNLVNIATHSFGAPDLTLYNKK